MYDTAPDPSRPESDELSRATTRSPWWLRHFRRELQFLLDLGALSVAFVLSYLLRFEFSIPSEYLERGLAQLPMVVLIQFAALSATGVYSFVWRYIGMAELRTFARAAVYSTIPILAMRFLLPTSLSLWRVPLSVIVMDAVFGFGGVVGLRVLRRAIYERYERARRRPKETPGSARRKRALLVGAGRAGLLAARELFRQGHSELDIVGFVDDDPLKRGSVIHMVPVLGRLDDLPDLVAEYEVEQVVITMIRASRNTVRELIDRCRRLGVEVRIMPALYEVLEGRVSVSRFREVRIEDLLGREPVHLEEESLEQFLFGSCILVTGAGGSIGSELARQAARFGPDRMVLVDRSEPALFEAHRDLRRTWPELHLSPVVCDVADGAVVTKLLTRCRPRIVLHAAAHKHVPMMEENPAEALRNNALATWRLGELAGKHGVERFVLVSTDKAVRPTSIMGASKRVAEILVQDLDRRFGTKFMAVRFGNVLGSTGSVIPIFREQIESGGPVTVTHPEMVRYFMTIPEAAQLVLQAATIGRGGEIFVLDMGEPVRILDLARDMIRLAGLEPERDVEIVFTGIRPGEKLFEELELGGEQLEKTLHPKIFTGRLRPYDPERVEDALEGMRTLVEGIAGLDEVRRFLGELLPEAQLGGSGRPDRNGEATGRESPIEGESGESPAVVEKR